MTDKQLNIERAEETITLLLSKLLFDNMINQEYISKTIAHIYSGEVLFR